MLATMSAEKGSNPCNKFQANIFNKSKCQNCFKSRELHLLSDHDQDQAKPIYAGWLCLAPVGTDFDNPMQRSRKWQRRFFILYEHGNLSFALDELRSTLPQGTVNLNQCTDIADAEPRTGQRNALWVVTSDQEIFIRGENKEIINGWSDQLAVYLRTNKQNQKKKRKVEPVTTQEPSPAKMAATDPPATESDSGQWQEEQRGRGPDVTPIWTVTDTEALCSERTPADPLTLDGGFPLMDSNDDITMSIQTSANNLDQSQDRSGVTAERILGSEAPDEQEGGAMVGSRGRSNSKREKLQSCGDLAQLRAPPPQRRAKSLDRRTSDTVMTPDLLNFKKGWMMKLDEHEQWKKYWFVLSTDSLRFYKDSITEEASDLEGEMDLTQCYNVSEYQVQRNYGFQIHTPGAVYTLSAMTAGIRRNWIQSLMKNVRPAKSPDVTSLPGHHALCGAPEALLKPDVTQDSRSSDVLSDKDPPLKPRSAMERRREGRYKTFDWAEFRPHNKAPPPLPTESDPPRIKSPLALELGDLDRKKRREERRRRYETMLGVSLSWGVEMDGGEVRALSPKSQQRVEEEIEECWEQVESTVLRLDRTVPLFPEARDAVEMEKLLDSYRHRVEDLKLQLEESESRRMEVEAQLSSAGERHQQEPPLVPEDVVHPSETKDTSPVGSREDAREASQEVEPEPSSPPPQQALGFGDFQDLGEVFREGAASPLLSPAPESPGCDHTLVNHGEATPLFSGEQLSPPDQAVVVRQLSREVEQLTSQNEALNQRNQEMLNQLTEADREIERLKVELSSRYTEPHHLPEVEQQREEMRAEDLQRELGLRDRELLEARALVASLTVSLEEAESLLKKQEVGDEKSEQKGEGYLLRCFEATEAKLTELERQLGQSESACRELEAELEEERRGQERKRIQKVMEGMVVRLEALGELLKAIGKLDFGEQREREQGEEPAMLSQLNWEAEFWSSVLHEEAVDGLVREVGQLMAVEREVLRLGYGMDSEEGEGGLTDVDGSRMFDFVERIAAVTEAKRSLLRRVASAPEKLQRVAEKLRDVPEHGRLGFLHSAATEALYCCRLKRLQEETKPRLRPCSSCVQPMQESEEPPPRQERRGEARDVCCQTDAQALAVETRQGPDVSAMAEEVSALRGRVRDLEELLAANVEEFDRKMIGALIQHEKEMEKLKATCQRGFTSMEESHVKVVEELQRRHLQEVERLLVERDQLLEEESAATATAIEAIKNAHCLELEREVERRCHSENCNGNTVLGDAHRQHSEELASYQRELEVLSQQFSLKCLENGHLVQALDAERKALCQCQQENQDLRNRNQELSGHLAAEITRLCSLAKQDKLPLSQGMDVYEMEITLRVKESEVQCLRQEITSLKDELQTAQRDKRNATKKYKDVFTELSIVRARADRELEELRENLRLAHGALDRTSPSL